jgi:uncharacterized protein YcbK (DUF882 family)
MMLTDRDRQISLNDAIPACRNFKWGEALHLRDWKMHAHPTDEVIKNIIAVGLKLQLIRDMFGLPIQVTSWWRPPVYNEHIGGSSRSYHRIGAAVDFIVMGLDCDDVRERLEPKLEEFGIRMEDKLYSDWVHIDIGKPGVTGRFFKV